MPPQSLHVANVRLSVSHSWSGVHVPLHPPGTVEPVQSGLSPEHTRFTVRVCSSASQPVPEHWYYAHVSHTVAAPWNVPFTAQQSPTGAQSG